LPDIFILNLYSPTGAEVVLSSSLLLYFKLLLKGGREAVTAATALIHYLVGVLPAPTPEMRSGGLYGSLMPASGLAQGSDAVELGLSTVLILPNIARRCHNSNISGGVNQLFFAHKDSRILIKLLSPCKDINNFREIQIYECLFLHIVGLVIKKCIDFNGVLY
jgi:hypothetical protein